MVRFFTLLLLVVLLSMSATAFAQDEAEIVNDEGGVTTIVGEMLITNPNVISSTYQPVIILEDQTGFVNRDLRFVPSQESQVIAQLTSPYQANEPITFTVSLPIEPRGELNDVDQDGRRDDGVQIFAVAFWDNRFGDYVYIDRLDWEGYGGWSTSYTTVFTSINPETLGEVLSGHYLVYAADDEQGFPSGFGDDGLLFTEDDPIVTIPAGYSLVNMDEEPFTFDRSNEVEVELLEPDSIAPDNFSEMSYAEAFEALLEKAENEYAFNGFNGVDWDELRDEFLPRFEEADDNNSEEEYLLALNDFARSIPDGHVGFGSPNFGLIQSLEQEQISGGLGFAVRELTDGRILVNYVLEGGPAEDAGIEFGAEITEINGESIQAAIEAAYSPNAPYSSPETRRLDGVRFVTRFPLDTDVEVTFINPGEDDEETVEITTIDERDSLLFSRQFVYGVAGQPPTAPVEFEFLLPDGYGYVAVSDFSGNEPLMIETWEYFLSLANAVGSPGIIIDMRYNLGGFSSFGNRMAGYFFEDEVEIGYRASYNPEIDDFFYREDFPSLILPPEDPSLIYTGPVVVLVGPSCASACEFFTYNFTLENRATILGQYSTNGIAGGWSPTYLPDDVSFALPTTRPLNMDQEVMIEGVGVQPTVRIPVTEENMADTSDVVLAAAVAYLDGDLEIEGTEVDGATETDEYTISDAGDIEIGDSADGSIAEGERIQYTLEVEDDVTVSILLEGADSLDTYLRVYDADDLEAGPIEENDDIDTASGNFSSLIEDLELEGGRTYIIEVATFKDGASGDYTLSIAEN